MKRTWRARKKEEKKTLGRTFKISIIQYGSVGTGGAKRCLANRTGKPKSNPGWLIKYVELDKHGDVSRTSFAGSKGDGTRTKFQSSPHQLKPFASKRAAKVANKRT